MSALEMLQNALYASCAVDRARVRVSELDAALWIPGLPTRRRWMLQDRLIVAETELTQAEREHEALRAACRPVLQTEKGS